jgi:hypothetical protein
MPRWNSNNPAGQGVGKGTVPPAYLLYRKTTRPSSGPLGLNNTIRRTGRLVTPLDACHQLDLASPAATTIVAHALDDLSQQHFPAVTITVG